MDPKVVYRSLSEFPRDTVPDNLRDAYAYAPRNRALWDENRQASDDFFAGNPETAKKYSPVTCVDGKPIGFVTWNPRHRPAYVEIGHNAVREAVKRHGYGHAQPTETLRRIRGYAGLKKVIVRTNSSLAAPKNYGSVGFRLMAG